MKIEVLYVPDCPNFQPAVERIRKVLAAGALRADIEGVAVNSAAEAEALHFPGSPTIRIDGTDVDEPQTNATGLACRLYASSGGVPSEEMLRLAFSRANKESEGG
jgi:hypothetical protein